MSTRIYVDLETTGVVAGRSAIIEIGALAVSVEGHEEDFKSLVNPGDDKMASADPRALAMNGIGRGDVRAAPSTEDVAVLFKAFCGRHPGAILHSFNVDFERSFLAAPPWDVQAAAWGECVMRASMEVMGPEGALDERWDGSPKWPSLSEAAAFFGVESGRHRALADARAARAIHDKIEKGRGRRGTS